MSYNVKDVTWRHLKKGQEIVGWQDGNSQHSASATVIDTNTAFVTLSVFDRYEEKAVSETGLFTVEISGAEFRLKYHKAAGELVRNIQNPMCRDEIGAKSQQNRWLYEPGYAYGVAACCADKGITVLGHCKDIDPRTSWFGDRLDTAICAEQDGERFWVHCTTQYLQALIETYRPGMPEKGVCCDCTSSEYDFIITAETFRERTDCKHWKEDGSCWSPPRL